MTLGDDNNSQPLSLSTSALGDFVIDGLADSYQYKQRTGYVTRRSNWVSRYKQDTFLIYFVGLRVKQRRRFLLDAESDVLFLIGHPNPTDFIAFLTHEGANRTPLARWIQRQQWCLYSMCESRIHHIIVVVVTNFLLHQLPSLSYCRSKTTTSNKKVYSFLLFIFCKAAPIAAIQASI